MENWCSSDKTSNAAKVTSVEIADGVTSIGDNAFYGCTNLESITLPAGLTTIGNSAFYSSGLTEITIPSGVKSIEASTFGRCKNLQKITLPDNLESIGNSAFYSSGITEITIPSSVTSIGASAFNGCTNLQNITLPDNLTSLEYSVFADSGIMEITIPSSVTSIGGQAFEKCKSLKNITLPAGLTSIGSSAFISSGLTEITIPSSVTEIGEKAFERNINLKSAKIFGNVSIADSMFYECTALSEVLLLAEKTDGADKTTIGNSAFYNCHSLNNIIISPNVTSIGDQAFKMNNAGNHCALTKITIPSSVTSIGVEAFFYQLKLENVTMESDTPPTNVNDRTFGNCSNLKIFVPTNTVDTYRNDEGWSEYADKIQEYTGSEESNILSGTDWVLTFDKDNAGTLLGTLTLRIVSDIGMDNWIERRSKGFEGIDAAKIKTVVIENRVTKIGESAFQGCTGLESIGIPSGVTTIGKSAFQDCSALEKVWIFADTVKSIGESAFQGCSGLTEVTIRAKELNTIGLNAFSDCSSLKRVTLRATKVPGNGTDNGEGREDLFSNCAKLSEIEVPLSSVDDYKKNWSAWANLITGSDELGKPDMASGKDWTLYADGKLVIQSDDGMKDWHDNGLYSNKNKVEEIAVQNGVTRIASGAFSGCSNLTDAPLPDSVKYIEESAFKDCEKLTNIEMPGVTNILTGAFQGCISLERIELPSVLLQIMSNAFSGCSSLGVVIMRSVSVPTIWSRVFDECRFTEENVSETDERLGIMLPPGRKAAYLESQGWAAYENYIAYDSQYFSGTGWSFDKDGKLTIETDKGMEDWCSKKKEEVAYALYATEVEIKEGVTSIEDEAFAMDPWYQQWIQLKTVDIPGTVTKIGYRAFYECQKLEEITIPANVEEIGRWAFEGCDMLGSVNVMRTETIPKIDSEAFYRSKVEEDGKNGIKDIKVPAGYGDKYRSEWLSYRNCITDGTEPETDEEKVAAAKKKVEAALEMISVSNDTTQDSFMTDFFQALGTVGGMGDGVSVSAGRLNVTKATEAAEGNVAVTIFIRCGTGTPPASDSVNVNKPIAKLTFTSDEKVAEAKTKVEAALETTIPVSNDTTRESLQAAVDEALKKALEEAGIQAGSVTATVGDDFSITKATADAEGSVKGTITVKSGETTATVTVDKKINRQPGTPAEKVAAAKAAVEAALETLRTSNATTKESLQAYIDKALKEAGTDSGVTVTVGELFVTKATETADGSISGNITIQSGTETAAVEVKKTINKLPDTPAGKVEAAKTTVEDVLETARISNATTQKSLQAEIDKALSEAGIDKGVTATVGELAVTPATETTEGSISGTITIESGTETATVEIKKTIDKLPGTDAGKVEAAKKAVEDALATVRLSNATTRESLQDAVDKALKEAGIDDSKVTATVGGLTVTPATETAEGSISGTITIKSGTETAAVEIKKTINRLPGTDAGKVEAAKKAVEDALATVRISNATTQESLQDAVDKALKEAGIADGSVTATVGDLTIIKATADTPGSVKGTITIQSGTETASVPVDKTIRKLPGTPAQKMAAVKDSLENALEEAVEKAREGKKITNANVEEISKKILPELEDERFFDRVLEEAGVDPGEFDLTEEPALEIKRADIHNKGSIEITIPFIIGTGDSGQPGIAKFQMPIPTIEEEAKQAVESAVENAVGTDGISDDTPVDFVRDAVLDAVKGVFGEKADIKVDGTDVEDVTPATEDTPGKRKFKFKLIIDGELMEFEVTVTIKKLGGRTGVYVCFTDYDKLEEDGEDSRPCYKYTGAAIKPAVEVYNSGTLLTPGKDYTISYTNNTKVGTTAGLKVKGKGSFTGTSAAVNFSIIKADIEKDTAHPAKMTVIENTKVAPVIMNGTKKLNAKDYKLEGDGLQSNGKYAMGTAGTTKTLKVSGSGSYEGSFEIEVTVLSKSQAQKFTVTVDKDYKPVYNGSAIDLSSLFSAQGKKGEITVTDSKNKTKTLEEGTDFTVACASGLSGAGTVQFTVTGMGMYTGSVTKKFKINPLKVTDSSKFEVEFDNQKGYEYKAAGATVDNLVVRYLGETKADTDGKVLTQDADYKVTYSNNNKVTENASFKITFLGNYKGSSAVTKNFKIVKAKLSADNTVVIVPDKVYSKANMSYKSTPIVSVGGVAVKASNYTVVSYEWAAGDGSSYNQGDKITLAETDAYANVQVKIKLKDTGSYEGEELIGKYYVRKLKAGGNNETKTINLTNVKVTFSNKDGELSRLEYNGRPFYTPAGNNPSAANAPKDDPNAVYVKVSVREIVGTGRDKRVNWKEIDRSLYNVTWTDATAKGKATVVITGTGTVKGSEMAVGSKTQTIKINAKVLKGKSLTAYMEKAVSSLKSMFSNIW